MPKIKVYVHVADTLQYWLLHVPHGWMVAVKYFTQIQIIWVKSESISKHSYQSDFAWIPIDPVRW